MDKVVNYEVIRRAGIKMKFASRMDQRICKLVGHVERTD